MFASEKRKDYLKKSRAVCISCAQCAYIGGMRSLGCFWLAAAAVAAVVSAGSAKIDPVVSAFCHEHGTIDKWDALISASFVKEMGFTSSLTSAIITHDITGSRLMKLSDESLEEMGLASSQSRRNLRRALEDARTWHIDLRTLGLFDIRALDRRRFNLWYGALSWWPTYSMIYARASLPSEVLAELPGASWVTGWFGVLVLLFAPRMAIVGALWHLTKFNPIVCGLLMVFHISSMLRDSFMRLTAPVAFIISEFITGLGGMVVTYLAHLFWPVIPRFLCELAFYVNIYGPVLTALLTILQILVGKKKGEGERKEGEKLEDIKKT